MQDGNFVKDDMTKDQLLSNDQTKQETKKKTDWCAIIPAASETAAAAMSEAKNNKIQQNMENNQGKIGQQAEAFYAMADVQKNLAKTTTVQAGGFAAAAACYATMMVTGKLNMSGTNKVNPIAKLSASTLLAVSSDMCSCRVICLPKKTSSSFAP